MSDERHHGRPPPEQAEHDLSGQNPSDPPLPERVGPYRIVDRIGAGGMGVVYRARDERLERWVAIKHIRPGEADLRSRERLRREARTVAGLSHPSIVQVHDIVETREGDWIVMELVQGKTLKELVEEDVLEMSQVLQLAREVAEGLAEAHAKGVVHRDLKTENVKITELGHAKILDFGLAKRVWQGNKEESLSVQGAILGTGRAMSPEQALGEEVNHLSDLFSFGTLLFETVTRRPPFVGSSLILTMAQICTEDQPSAKDLNPEVPRELSALIDHLLQKDPLQRPQSAGEVVEALQRIAARMTSRKMADEAGDPSDTAVAPAVPPGPPVATRSTPAVARLPSRSSGVRPVTMSRSSESTAGIFIKTLVETSLVGGERLGDRFGDADAYELFSRHDRLARDVLAEHDGFEIHRTDEGFLFLFERPVDAVEFVLAYQRSLAEFSVEVGLELEMRSAIHLSEIYLRENTPEEIHRGAKPFEVEGLAKLLVSRVMALARGGQTLLTQEAYDMTRRALVGHPLATRKLHWRAHGQYLFAGVDEAVRIFEVATESIAASGRLLETPDAQRLAEEDGAPRLRRPGRRRKLLIAAAALAPVIAASAIVRLGMEKPAAPVPAESAEALQVEAPPSLAVLGFRNLTGNEDDAWLSTALAELLSAELGGGADLRLVPGETVSRAKKRQSALLENETLAPDTLRQLRDDLGSEYVILGSYLSLGEEKRLTVQMKLQDTAKGETVAMVQQAGTENELPDLVSRISKEVRERMGLPQRASDSRALQASLSNNNEANRFFYEGLERFRDFDFTGARDDFLEAIRLDPGFAMAYADLSRAWLTLGYDAKAAEAGQRAYELAQNLPREGLLWIEGIYYESIGNLEGAISTLRALWRVYPEELKYGLRLAELQIAANRGEEAFATLSDLRKLPPPSCDDPRIDLAEAHAAMAVFRLQRVVDAAERAIAKGRPRDNAAIVAEAQRLRGRALVDLEKPDEALRALEEAQRLFREIGDDLGLGKTLFSFAYLEQAKRNPSHAEQLLREALDIFENTGSRRSILHAQHGLAYMIQLKGELKAARQLLEEARQTARDIGSTDLEAWTLNTLSFVLYQSGELVRAERMLRDLIRISRERNDRRTERWARVNLGFTLFSAGKLTEARELFEEVSKTGEDAGDQQATLALNGLGAIHYEMDDLPEAERLFKRYLEIQSASGEWGEQALTEPLHAATLLELGRLEEARKTSLAIAARFHDAELVLYEAEALGVAAEALRRQGRVDEAREQLAEALALTGEIESPEVRLRLELTAIRLLAADDPQEAVRRLRPLIGEATRLNLKPVELESLLALGQIEMRLDAAADREVARARLEALAEEASRRGFDLVARQARASLKATEPAAGPGSARRGAGAR